MAKLLKLTEEDEAAECLRQQVRCQMERAAEMDHDLGSTVGLRTNIRKQNDEVDDWAHHVLKARDKRKEAA